LRNKESSFKNGARERDRADSATDSDFREKGLRVLIVDDEEHIRTYMLKQMKMFGHEATAVSSGEDALRVLKEAEFDVVLMDIMMSGKDGLTIIEMLRNEESELDFIVMTGQGTKESVIKALRLDCFDYLEKPIDMHVLKLTLARFARKRFAEKEARAYRSAYEHAEESFEILGKSERMLSLMKKIDKVAVAESSVLIVGESGTGKELIAREIHKRSPRRDRPIDTVNCSALQSTLLESELFGHEKGSFTGADSKKLGLFEIADGGTMFLDEIGEMDAAIQTKLLRTLQFGEVRRVGSNKTLKVDVRIIAATNKNLQAEMAAGRFREDLYYRLSVITLEAPPLRDRKGDVMLLAETFLERMNRKVGAAKKVSGELKRVLEQYRWPGNVRELRNVVESLVILSEGEMIGVEDLPPAISSLRGSDEPMKLASAEMSLAELEKLYITELLRKNAGNKLRTSRILGITPTTLYNKIRAYKIEL
jgi:DNA-binding NtrC family response regulator